MSSGQNRDSKQATTIAWSAITALALGVVVIGIIGFLHGVGRTLFGTVTIVGSFYGALGSGAVMYASLHRNMADYRQRPNGAKKHAARTSLLRLPLLIGRKFGSLKVLDTQECVDQDTIELFWGFALLVLGFVAQLVGGLGTLLDC